MNSNEQSILTFSSLSTSADQFVAQLNIPSLILPSGSVPTIDNALVDPSDNTNFNSILRTPLSSFETRDLQNGNNETFIDLLNLLNEEQNDSNAVNIHMRLNESLSDVFPVAASLPSNSRENVFIESPSKRIVFTIVSRYISSPIVANNVVNLLDRLEIGQSITLSDLLASTPSKIRPDKLLREQLVQELSDSNLFSIRRPRQNAILISKTLNYV